MKAKNKKLLYALGSMAAIAPLPLAGMIFNQKKDEINSKQQANPYEFNNIAINGVISTFFMPESSNYHYFIGTTHGLYVSKDGVNYSLNLELSNRIITSMVNIPDVGLIVGTNGDGLWTSTNDGATFLPGTPFLHNKIDREEFTYTTVLSYVDNTLLVGTQNNGVWMSIQSLTQLERVGFVNTPGGGANVHVTAITMALIPSVFKYAPIPIIATADQGLYAPSGLGLLSRIGTGTGGIVTGWQINALHTVTVGSSNIIFVGTEGHGLLVSKDEGVTFNLVSGIADNNYSVESISSARDGSVLVGTKNNGLWKASDVYATTFTQVAGGLGNNWDIISINNTNVGLYVGTLDNGLLISSQV